MYSTIFSDGYFNVKQAREVKHLNFEFIINKAILELIISKAILKYLFTSNAIYPASKIQLLNIFIGHVLNAHLSFHSIDIKWSSVGHASF